MLWIEASHEGQTKRVEVDQTPVRIGRAADCDMSFPSDKQMSRNHATVERRPNGWFVVDHKSTNGSYVNGQRVTVPFPIKDGDIVEVGDQRLRVVESVDLPPA